MKTMRTCLWLLPPPNWESTVLHYISGKKELGTGKRTRMIEAKAQAEAASGAERIRTLEKENAKLREERDILRKAAKYFADKTRW